MDGLPRSDVVSLYREVVSQGHMRGRRGQLAVFGALDRSLDTSGQEEELLAR